MRRKEFSQEAGTLKAEYNYFLAGDNDAGFPFNTHSSADEMALHEARESEERMEVFKKYRPPSTGEGTY